MAITHKTDWVIEGGEWTPVCPDCHRLATPDGTFPQCSARDWASCYRRIQDVLARTGPPPAPRREWPRWMDTIQA
jgi:hypothetical protein